MSAPEPGWPAVEPKRWCSRCQRVSHPLIETDRGLLCVRCERATQPLPTCPACKLPAREILIGTRHFVGCSLCQARRLDDLARMGAPLPGPDYELEQLK